MATTGDVTLTPRFDGQGYIEGITWGQGFLMGIPMLTWLQPGVTYTPHMLSNAGQIMLPIMDGGTNGEVTDLCAAPNPAEADGRYISMKIDKQVTGVFDGCFTVNGIAEINWEALKNNATFRRMALQYQNYIMDEVIAEGEVTTATIDVAADAFGALMSMRSEYFFKTGFYPNVALVSQNAISAILTQKIQLLSSTSEGNYVTGLVGETAGLTLVQADLPAGVDIVMLSPRAINIVQPSTFAQASPMIMSGFQILGAMAPALDLHSVAPGVEFNSGMISMIETHPSTTGTLARTYVFKPFGLYVEPKLAMLSGSVTPPPAP